MTTRQEWAALVEEFTAIRERVKKIGYELDDMYAKSRRVAPDLGNLTLKSIESAAALTNDLGVIMVTIADRGLGPE